MAFPYGGSAEEQRTSKESTTEAAVEKASPAEQRVVRQFISPHPSVDFADVPVICGIQSSGVASADLFDPRLPLFPLEAVSPSLKPSEVGTEPSSFRENVGRPARATRMSQQSGKAKAQSSSAAGGFQIPAQTTRPELSVGSGIGMCDILIQHKK